jgi:hypothetical protein
LMRRWLPWRAAGKSCSKPHARCMKARPSRAPSPSRPKA